MALVGIEYDEENPGSYKGVKIKYGKREGILETIFKSGNFVKDWYACNKFIMENKIDENEDISYSSSVDHFIMDGAPFESKYLRLVNDKLILGGYEYQNPGLEFFVHKGESPVWEELKEYCKKID